MKFSRRKLIVLETNLDDMNPQFFEPLMGRLFEAGALDVVLLPAVMKKTRPATLVQVLSEPRHRERLIRILFEESTTLGIRSYPVTRFELERETRRVKTRYGVVTVKVGRDPTGAVMNVSPEFRSCLELARRKEIPLKKIFEGVR